MAAPRSATVPVLDPVAADRAMREAIAAAGAMRVKDACAFVGLGETELYALMKDGTRPYAMVGSGGGRRVIPKTSLVKYLADRMVVADDRGE